MPSLDDAIALLRAADEATGRPWPETCVVLQRIKRFLRRAPMERLEEDFRFAVLAVNHGPAFALEFVRRVAEQRHACCFLDEHVCKHRRARRFLEERAKGGDDEAA